MKIQHPALVYGSLVLFCVVGACSLSGVFAQVPKERVPGQPNASQQGQAFDEDGIPAAALLTERGKQLAEGLRNLRRSRSNLGAKHPSLPLIDQKIQDTLLELRAWIPADYGDDENPFKERFGASPKDQVQDLNSTKLTPQINDEDMQQLVLRLIQRVETLETKVERLEQSR